MFILDFFFMENKVFEPILFQIKTATTVRDELDGLYRHITVPPTVNDWARFTD